MGEMKRIIGWNLWFVSRPRYANSKWTFIRLYKNQQSIMFGFHRARLIVVLNLMYTYLERNEYRRRWLWAGVGPVRNGDELDGISVFAGKHCWNLHRKPEPMVDPGGYMSLLEEERDSDRTSS
jgi:hypothetical protein